MGSKKLNLDAIEKQASGRNPINTDWIPVVLHLVEYARSLERELNEWHKVGRILDVIAVESHDRGRTLLGRAYNVAGDAQIAFDEMEGPEGETIFQGVKRIMKERDSILETDKRVGSTICPKCCAEKDVGGICKCEVK